MGNAVFRVNRKVAWGISYPGQPGGRGQVPPGEPPRRASGRSGTAAHLRIPLHAVEACPSCGQRNPATARYCSACGTRLTDGARTAEERKIVSVLFVDLVGFTARSDRADPEDVRDLLQLYHSRVKEQAERFSGTVEKFIGDAVVAVFGAPATHTDDPERAVRAGLRALAAVQELNRSRPDLDLVARAAVNTGEAVVATGARHQDGEALAMGDVVNTASRLQAAAPPGRLIVGEETYRATHDGIRYEAIGAVETKGKKEPVKAWLAVEPIAPGERRSGGGRLVGRERELALLRSVWESSAKENRPHLVTVIGPPGIGKSRLSREFASLVQAGGGRSIRGRCLPYDTRDVYGAFAEQVKDVAQIFEQDPRHSLSFPHARVGSGSAGGRAAPSPLLRTEAGGATRS
ncbi:MAG: zinc-ribbon domain-containing protein [Chloroflexi bacterium]|nr:MAG: zinc-ribbon domain-containing protein [Chloroflexota bacterium]